MYFPRLFCNFGYFRISSWNRDSKLYLFSIFSTCHLCKYRYRVYWNLSYPLSILKVIFMKSNPLWFKETLFSFNNKQRRHWKGDTIWLCAMGNVDRTFCPKLLATKRTFDLLFSHFCYIKSYFSYLICSYMWR
jgi:hypothetical protein